MTLIKELKIRGFKSFPKLIGIPFNTGYNTIIGANGSGKSISYSSIVTLSNGKEIEIGKLIEEKLKNSNKIEKLDDGIYCDGDNTSIISINPVTMKSEIKPISKFIKREGEELYRIITRSGREVKATGCHPIMVFKEGILKSTLIRDLKEKEFIATPRIITSKTDSNFNKDKARLIGYIIGDGYISSKRIEFVNRDKEIIDDFVSLIKQFYPGSYITQRKEKGLTRVYTSQKEFFNEIRSYFQGVKNKSITSEYKNIPNDVLNSSNETISNILVALFDTDGNINKKKGIIEFCSKNESLVKQMQRLLLRYSILSKIKKRMCCATNTEEKIKRDYYYLYISGINNIMNFYKNFHLKCSYKQDNLRSICAKNIKSNPNVDLLPKEANSYIKNLAQLLGLNIKDLSKEHPKLKAYCSNECLTSREGVLEVLELFDQKLSIFLEYYSTLKIDQTELINCMDELNISGRSASKSIGLSQQVIRDYWASKRFNARQKNLDSFYTFIKSTLQSRLIEIKNIMQVLYNLATSDIYWDEIDKIEKTPKEEFVYDLTIKNNHNFIANGIYVHNSNITDAICFVLGKTSAKSLRAEKSANLIFHGGKKGQPAKEAQVDIIFDNSKKDFAAKTSDVKITRTVKQNGNSTYRINDEVVTRQQVIDLLSTANIEPDGHNIVLQGDIIAFTEMRTEERRELIEEISGISIYEDKKQKAMNELEKVDSKLNEATIILTEREIYMKELKKERDQAEKYKDLEGNIKSNKATYIHLHINEKEEKKNEVEKRIKEQSQERDKYDSEIKRLRELIEAKKNELSVINKEIESKGEVEQKKLHSEIETLKIDFAKNTMRLDVCSSELEKIDSRKKQLDKSLVENNNNIGDLSSKKQKLEKEIKNLGIEESKFNESIKNFKEKHNLSGSIVKNIDEIDSSIEKLQESLGRTSQNKQEKQRELDKIKFELDSLKIADNKEKLEELKNIRNDFKNATAELSKLMNELAVTESQSAKTRKSIIDIDEKLAKLNVHSIGAQEMASLDIGMKKILDLKDKGVLGTVSNLGKIQSKYSIALSVAAGPRVKSIVVDNEITAARCIGYLKEHKLGVVTFLPLNKMLSRPIPSEVQAISSMPGVHGLAINLIEYDRKFKDVFNYVFGSTVVVSDITTARKIGIGRARMVTLDGDVMETSGAMIGGFRRRIAAGFKEKDLDLDIKTLEEELSRNKKLIDMLEDKEDNLNDNIHGTRNKKAMLEAEILKYEKAYGISDLEALKEKQSSLLEKEKSLLKELKINANETDGLESEINKLKSARSKIKEKAADSSIAQNLNKLEEEHSKVKERMLAIKSELSNIELQTNTIFGQEKEKIASILNSLEKEKQSFSGETASLANMIKDQKNQLKEKESLQKRFYSDYNNLFAKRNKIDEEIKKNDFSIVKNEERIKSIQQRLNNIEIDRAKVVAEMAGLEKEFEQFKDEKIRRGMTIPELKDEINKYENMLKNLGNVNMRALEIYNQAEKEYNNILEKTSTLKLEKDDILKLMYEIESKKKDLFMKTYKILNSNFKTIFNSLTTKGEAYMEIGDEENLFSSGVDIKVRIASNKFLDLKSLSGGEKSMAALAFIFAIQEYQPASFYLMDEVDAALDKTNSDLLSKLIKKYSEKAQYIVISHNDQVITEADTIYGVSMQDSVSKVVSLKV